MYEIFKGKTSGRMFTMGLLGTFVPIGEDELEFMGVVPENVIEIDDTEIELPDAEEVCPDCGYFYCECDEY